MIPRKPNRGKPYLFRGSLLVVLLLLPALAPGADAQKRDQAVRLYDEGRYAEARELLEQLDAAGEADGVLLYRLHYCQLQDNDPAARSTLQRAREHLESEASTSTTLEAPFYLANAYSNIGRLSDAERVAREATDRFEQGALPAPERGIDFFRLGKLYADQRRVDPAVEWYTKAVETLTTEGSSAYGAYVEWASSYLSEQALEGDDPALAATLLSRTVDPATSSAAELDRLAVLQLRAKQYAEAEESWRAAERRDPINGDRARYCQRLAGMAAGMPELPPLSEDGRPWSELSREELDQVMSAQAATVRAVIEEARALDKLKRKKRRQYQARIDGARARFVAAGLEFAARSLGIREAAFFGGYAPLIFRPGEWELPADAE